MAINFKKLFQTSRIECRDDVNKNWVNVNCPFCVNPTDVHFNGGFNVLSPRYNCWRCGSHPWHEAISRLTGIPVEQANDFVRSYEYVSTVKERKAVPLATHLDLPGFRLNDLERKYLENRGFNVDYLLSKFHVRGGGEAGDWSYRILVPIYYKNVLVSWTGRSILTREQLKQWEIPRYKNLSIEQSVVNPKEIFFNLDNCHNDYVLLVEGPFDVMKMGDDCVCSLGTSVTREQELFLKTRFKKVYVCFDNEPSAQAKARKLALNLCSVGLNVEVVNICEPFGKNDPGELLYSEVEEVKKELFFS